MARKEKTPAEIANLIERFLSCTSLYPQEWDDFVSCRTSDARLDVYRKRCDILGGDLEHGPVLGIIRTERETRAIDELRNRIVELRILGEDSK
jgi:hypothetical protein